MLFRSIAANPYMAEGLTGRTVLTEHLYWHASNVHGPEWAIDCLESAACDWTAEEIDFVDWVFKTSFINLRGFAQTLTTNPYYVDSNVDNVIAYVNEVKPYHAQIRQFVDLRLVSDTWINHSTDFDKPPYTNQQGTQIDLDPNNPNDQIILGQDPYRNWYDNYQLLNTLDTSNQIRNAMLMRRMKNRQQPRRKTTTLEEFNQCLDKISIVHTYEWRSIRILTQNPFQILEINTM